jgi:origin recognition complex subunit 5
MDTLKADELDTLLPSLTPTLSLLRALLARPFPPDFLYVHAPHNARLVSKLIHCLLSPTYSPNVHLKTKSKSLPHIQHVLPRFATVDCLEVHSPKVLYDRVLNCLSGWDGSSGSAWDDALGGVENWDGRMQGVQVVQKGGRRSGQPVRKRPRLDDDPDTEEEKGGGGEWTVAWDRSVPRVQAGKGVLTQRKDESFDTFCDGLRAIFQLGREGKDSGGRDLDRLLVFEHAERLAFGMGEPQGVEGSFLASLTRLGQMASIPTIKLLEIIADFFNC